MPADRQGLEASSRLLKGPEIHGDHLRAASVSPFMRLPASLMKSSYHQKMLTTLQVQFDISQCPDGYNMDQPP
jgi:hypothetical protein